MKKLSRSEKKSTISVLNLICTERTIGKEAAFKLFDTKDVAIDILFELDASGIINIIKIDQGDGIASIRATSKTCHASKNHIPSKMLRFNSIIYKLAKNAIIQIMGILVIVYSFLKIIESIFGIDIPNI